MSKRDSSGPPSFAPNWGKDFPSVGQGTIIFNMVRDTDFSVFIRPKLDEGEPGAAEYIKLSVTKGQASFSMKHQGPNDPTAVESLLVTVKDSDFFGKTGYKQTVGYEADQMIAYWISYNRDLMQIKYGRGYVMEETTLMTYDFIGEPGSLPEEEEDEIRKEYKYLFSPTIRRMIEQYDPLPEPEMVKLYSRKIKASGRFEGKPLKDVTAYAMARSSAEKEEEVEAMSKTIIDMEHKVQLRSAPFCVNWSPVILDSSKLTLETLDTNDWTMSASLPSACQELYRNVINLELDSPTDPWPLSEAIGYSITNPDGELHKAINQKDEFGPGQAYLRVTLGPNRGRSAGIPYVLEIWPIKNGSPIHNHGNCFAVIKVLHGGLNIEMFNKQTTRVDEAPLKSIQVKAGDATWITPNWFQSHKLYNNHPTEYCATVQCYQYGVYDDIHWPYFDFVDDGDTIDEFFPNSDYDFKDMKRIVMKEFDDMMNSTKTTSTGVAQSRKKTAATTAGPSFKRRRAR